MDIAKHKTNLTNILIDFYKDSLLSSRLGFKGGTAAMLFYNLPRFSVDLDFDYLGSEDEIEKIIKRIDQVLDNKFEIKDKSTKYDTLFWLLSYKKGEHTIKIEVSTRDNSLNHYNSNTFYGTSIKVLDIKDMIAHKMVAFTERPTVAYRDLFDIHFFLKTEFASEINYQVIKTRTRKKPKEFYKYMLLTLEKINPKDVLSGLGEVLTQSQKDWAKAKLVSETKELIKRQIDFLPSKEEIIR